MVWSCNVVLTSKSWTNNNYYSFAYFRYINEDGEFSINQLVGLKKRTEFIDSSKNNRNMYVRKTLIIHKLTEINPFQRRSVNLKKMKFYIISYEATYPDDFVLLSIPNYKLAKLLCSVASVHITRLQNYRVFRKNCVFSQFTATPPSL